MAVAAVLGKSLGSLALLAMAGSAVADTYTYNPTATATDNWSTGVHWNAVPVSGIDTILVFSPTGGTFPAAVTNGNTNNIGTFQLNQLTLGGIGAVADASPVSVNIAGGTLDFRANTLTESPIIILEATNGAGAGSSVTYDVSSSIVLTDDVTILGNGNATFNFGGVISGGGILTKAGDSVLKLSGANTYTGLTAVTGGTLAYGANNVIGSGGVSVIGGTSILAMGANSDIVGTVTVDGGGSITGTGTLTSTGSFEMFSGTVSVVLGGAVALNKNSAGTVVLSGANTYSGVTTLNEGVLNLGSAGALGGGGSVTFGGGTLQYSASNASDLSTRIVNSTGAISIDVNARTVTYASALAASNTGGLALSGTGGGTLVLSGTNAYLGVTTLNSGTLNLGSAGALGGGGNVTFAGGTLQHSASNTSDLSTRIVNSSSPISIDVNGQTVTYASSLGASNTGGLTVLGTGGGALILAAAKNYSGLTTVTSGTLQYGVNNALGSGDVTVNGATAVLALGANSDTVGIVTLDGGGSITGTGPLSSTSAFEMRRGTASVALSGGVGLNKDSSGTVILSGANTYTGLTTIYDGVLGLGSAGALGGGGNVTFFGGFVQHSASNTSDLSTRIVNSGGAIGIDVNGQTITYASALAASNTGGLTVAGTGGGTLILGAVNNYTGLTTVSSGTLQYGVSNAIGSGDVTVNGATATLNLGANSDTVGVVTLSGGGSITGTTGVLTSTAAYEMNSGTASAILGGTVGLNKNTLGIVTLSGANTYSGTTTLNSGVLRISSAANLGNGSATNNIVFTGTATLQSTTGTYALGTNRTILLSATGTNTIQVDTTGNILTIDGVISGPGGFTKMGQGAVTLTGNNTYSGPTIIGQAASTTTSVLNINSPTAIGTGALVSGTGGNVTINNTSGNAITLTNNNAINLSNGDIYFTGTSALSFGTGVLTLSGANRKVTVFGTSLTIGSIAADSPSRVLTKEQGGTLIITGAAAASFQGGLNLNGGPVLIGHKDALGYGNLIGNGGTLQASTDLSGANKLTIGISLNSPQFSGSNNIEFGGKVIGMSGGDRSITNNMTGGAVLTLNAVDINTDASITNVHGFTINGSGGTTVINGVIANGGGGPNKVTLNNAVSITFNGNNTYTGITLVQVGSNGVVNLNGDNTAATGGVQLANGKLNVNTSTALGPGTFNVSGASTIDNTSGSAKVLTLNNAVTLGGNLTFSTPAGTVANNLTFGTGTISQAADRIITLNGAGALTFGGILSNTGTSNRVLTVNNGTSTAATSILSFAGLTLTGAGTAARTFTINGGGRVTITGAITDGLFPLSAFSYTGSGTLTLAGNSTYTGLTTINGTAAATVTITGDNSAATGGLTLSAGRLNLNSTTALGTTGTVLLSGGTVDNTSGSAKVLATNNPITIGGNIAFGNNTGTLANSLTFGTGAVSMAANRVVILNGAGVYGFGGALVSTAGNADITLTVSNGIGTTATSALSLVGFTLSGGGATTARTNLINGSANVNITGEISDGSVAGSSLAYGGPGTLTLTGTNTYTGVTAVSNGVLQVGNGGTSGTLGTGAVIANGTLAFNRSDSVTVNNDISGGGTVTNNGGAANVLNLNGAQSYATLNANSGTTNVNSSFTAPATVNANGGSLTFSSNQTLAALNIGAGATVTFQDLPSFADFGGPTTAAVPEPGTMGLLLVGALGMLARRRRQD